MWENIASMVPTKNMEDLKQHYQMLVEDVGAIESGQIPIPNYDSVSEEATKASTKAKDHRLHPHGATGSDSNKIPNSGLGSGFSGLSHNSSAHAAKGGSRSCSCVEWHHLASSIRRFSVNNGGGDVMSHQSPITGHQTNGPNQSNPPALGPPGKHGPQQHLPGIGMYGAPVGHPVAARPGHMASAVDTPVMLPHGIHPHPPYVMPLAYPMAPPQLHQ